MEGTIGEIRMFAGNFEPKSWAFCQGQIMAISGNTALYSILGTTYGGDGRSTFALPDLGGRTAVGAGQSGGTSQYQLGQQTGSENVTLTPGNLPPHVHQQMASSDAPVQNTAEGAVLASNTRSTNPPMANIYAANADNSVAMGSMTAPAGGGQPVNVVQPSLGMNYVICLFGTFPPHN
jgi:microcystin-dependent protein